MDILQIVILGLGAILFTVSFFIPDKQPNPKETKEKEEKIFKELMQRELPDIRKKMDEEVQESIERVKENTQRQMERLTNEKMMAINEYSDTVMTEIHKNHEEAVFLYDMLNNKHAQVKNTAAELAQIIKQSKQVQSAVKSTKAKEEKIAGEISSAKGSRKKASQEEKTPAVKTTEQATEQTVTQTAAFEPMEAEKLEKIAFGKNVSEQDKAQAALPAAEEKDHAEKNAANNVEILFATEGNEENSNDRILELHKAGKSNMAIARELGLGIGEVKLVIDLFKGGM